jgi:POT family proton-dependent oligopeptide transporter
MGQPHNEDKKYHLAGMSRSAQITLEEIQDFKGKYPKQLWALFFSEMWERFCFYGNRGMLTIFISEILLQRLHGVAKSLAESQAQLQYGAIQAFVYAFTFIGGLFADKIIGFHKSLLWGGALMITGSFILGYDPVNLFYEGICFIIIGTGFFKPNISTMVGALYREGDPRRDAGFGLFYSGINIGALFGGAVCVYVGKFYSWNIAFALSGIFILIGLITFILTRRSLGPIGLQPDRVATHPKGKMYEWMVYAGSLLCIPFILVMVTNTRYTDLFMYLIGPLTLVYLVYEMRSLSRAEIRRLSAALVFIVFSVVFWAFFEQSGGSLSLFAMDNLHTNLLWFHIDPNVVNNSVNSFFVVLFSPLFGLLWIYLAGRNIEPNAVLKFGVGFIFLALAFFLLYYDRNFMDVSGKTSLNLFTFAYLVMTLAELCISPIGLSLMTKLSPRPLQGVMMGMWFLASAYGQYVAGILGAGMATVSEDASMTEKLIAYTDGYSQLAIYAVVCGFVLIALSPLVKKLMMEVK